MLKPTPTDVFPQTDSSAITKQQWKWSALAGMASYLDAGSIVALGAGLALFQKQFNLSDGAVGMLQAIGPNAIGCALGAFIGGWLGDKLGRKRIYQYDLLVYAAGILCIALAMNKAMLFTGTFVIGLAVGADVPTSLALVGELAPAKGRGKLLGFTQVAWCLGPTVVLWLALALARAGLLGIRIVFLHLFVVAMVTWVLRRGLSESARWTAAAATAKKINLKMLFSGANLRALLWTATIYLFWNLAAGTAGAFNSYLITSHNAGSQALGVGLPSAAFITAMIVSVTIFMRYADRSHRTRKLLWGVGALVQIFAYGILIVMPFSVPVIIVNILLFSAGNSLAGEAFYKVFSQELFPTLLRGTAQGITFGLARTAVGVWSFFVPVLSHSGGIPVLAALLTLFLIISGTVGFFFMPNTSGKTLEQIEAERADA